MPLYIQVIIIVVTMPILVTLLIKKWGNIKPKQTGVSMGKEFGRVFCQACVALSGLIMSAVVLVLFFMWLPDFFSWYSSKTALIEGGFFGIIPLIVVVSGLCGGTILIMLSACNLRCTTDDEVTA